MHNGGVRVGVAVALAVAARHYAMHNYAGEYAAWERKAAAFIEERS